MRGVVDPQDELLHIEQDFAKGISVSTSNFGNYVSYLPIGMSQGPNNLGNGTFSLCLEHMQRKVILSVSGRIRLDSGNC